MTTTRLTTAQAPVRYLANQFLETERDPVRLCAGGFAALDKLQRPPGVHAARRDWMAGRARPRVGI